MRLCPPEFQKWETLMKHGKVVQEIAPLDFYLLAEGSLSYPKRTDVSPPCLHCAEEVSEIKGLSS